MSKEKIVLTKEGYDALQNEYKELTEIRRPEIMRAVQEARALGDLKENGMYTAAREKQSFTEGRILEIEDILKRVEIIQPQVEGSATIALGSKVKIEIEKQIIEYAIVGQEEVDTSAGKISHDSPLGQALLGKEIGDIIEVNAPMGVVKYKVVEIG